MKYISTRGNAPVLGFEDVLLAGLAEDGGLYVPENWPQFPADEWRAMRGLAYPDVAARVIGAFTGGQIAPDALRAMCYAAYTGFNHPAVVPLVQVDQRMFVAELFHGPTLAFKDMALQLIGHLFDHVLEKRDARVAIVGATSGDTGSAAIEACRGRKRVDVVILHPEGRTSAVQRRQMTTVDEPNVGNVALQGNFDDCQDMVKAMFADAPFRVQMQLSAVNSINWARIAAQVAYYAWSALQLGAPERSVAFSVPTGNFGNVLAAWVAGRMGLPVAKLIIGSNQNDILTRFLAANDMSARPVEPSLSPSMDILVSSNFERLLFELLGRDGAQTAQLVQRFRTEGHMPVPDAAWKQATAQFSGFMLDDAGTLEAIQTWYRRCGYLADPHSVIGLEAARAHMPADRDVPVVVMATAHPAKFPDAVERATGVRPALPAALADLFERPEKFTVLPNDLGAVENFVRALVMRNAA